MSKIIFFLLDLKFENIKNKYLRIVMPLQEVAPIFKVNICLKYASVYV